jgi:hypothetical protein
VLEYCLELTRFISTSNLIAVWKLSSTVDDPARECGVSSAAGGASYGGGAAHIHQAHMAAARKAQARKAPRHQKNIQQLRHRKQHKAGAQNDRRPMQSLGQMKRTALEHAYNIARAGGKPR